MYFTNRATKILGVAIPNTQAPMGFIARPELVAADSEASAMGLVPGSLGIDEVRADIRRTRELTAKQFGANLPIAFVRDAAIVHEGILCVTTSAGSPEHYTAILVHAS